MDNGDVIAVADKCREKYVMLRRMMTGQPKYSAGDRWYPCFLKTAELIIAKEYDLDAYIQAQFGGMNVCQPNMLCSREAEDRYRAAAYKTDAGETVDPKENKRLERERRFVFEVEYIKSRRKIGLPLAEILDHLGSPISALTRYCAANAAGLYPIRNKYRVAARAQFKLAPDEYSKLYAESLGGLNG